MHLFRAALFGMLVASPAAATTYTVNALVTEQVLGNTGIVLNAEVGGGFGGIILDDPLQVSGTFDYDGTSFSNVDITVESFARFSRLSENTPPSFLSATNGTVGQTLNLRFAGILGADDEEGTFLLPGSVEGGGGICEPFFLSSGRSCRHQVRKV